MYQLGVDTHSQFLFTLWPGLYIMLDKQIDYEHKGMSLLFCWMTTCELILELNAFVLLVKCCLGIGVGLQVGMLLLWGSPQRIHPSLDVGSDLCLREVFQVLGVLFKPSKMCTHIEKHKGLLIQKQSRDTKQIGCKKEWVRFSQEPWLTRSCNSGQSVGGFLSWLIGLGYVSLCSLCLPSSMMLLLLIMHSWPWHLHSWPYTSIYDHTHAFMVIYMHSWSHIGIHNQINTDIHDHTHTFMIIHMHLWS